MSIKSFHDLELWHKALDMVDAIYDLTEDFPKTEMFGLANQLKRAAVSVPSNIAEGSARNGTKELLHFLAIARGSLAEIETQLEISKRRKYGKDVNRNKAFDHVNRIGQMSARLMQSLQRM